MLSRRERRHYSTNALFRDDGDIDGLILGHAMTEDVVAEILTIQQDHVIPHEFIDVIDL